MLKKIQINQITKKVKILNLPKYSILVEIPHSKLTNYLQTCVEAIKVLE
jgi:hypothetical protein